MEENLEHIDLIDKHITGMLSEEEQLRFNELMETDPEFSKEVAVYERLYGDVEEHEDAALKERLGGYYEEYQAEEGGRSKGRQRFLYWATGIAACLAIGFFVFRGKPDPDPIPISEDDPAEIDTTQTIRPLEEPKNNFTQQDDEPSQVEPDETPDVRPSGPVMALGGLQTIPAASIKVVTYPAPIEYTFDGKMVTIFGDPLLAPLQLALLKSGNEYVLNIKGKSYPLKLTSQRTQLTERQTPYRAGASTGENLSVKIENVGASAQQAEAIEARVTGKVASRPSYIFEQQSDKKVLTLDVNWPVNEIKVWQIKGGLEHFVVQYRNNLYMLDAPGEGSKGLTPRGILADNTTRLFRERAPLELTVRQAN